MWHKFQFWCASRARVNLPHFRIIGNQKIYSTRPNWLHKIQDLTFLGHKLSGDTLEGFRILKFWVCRFVLGCNLSNRNQKGLTSLSRNSYGRYPRDFIFQNFEHAILFLDPKLLTKVASDLSNSLNNYFPILSRNLHGR
jgi:hypothetical protein